MTANWLICAGACLALAACPAGNAEALAQCQLEWDPAFWDPAGNGHGPMRAWTVFDDGSGLALYANGWFRQADGMFWNDIGKWDGVAWTPLQVIEPAEAMAVYDDGQGPALYVAGNFETIGGVAAHNFARWDGTTWSQVGYGLEGAGCGSLVHVNAMTVFDDGTRPALYIGGEFGVAWLAPQAHLAKWDGTNLSPVVPDVGATVDALAVFDDGYGPALYVGGLFLEAGDVGLSHIGRWDGYAWSDLGWGMDLFGEVQALTVFDDGTGPALYVGGMFTSVDAQPINHIAKWKDFTWYPLGDGVTGGYSTTVCSLAVFHDRTGPALYVGGRFLSAGGQSTSGIARWDGTNWSTLGAGLSRPGYPGPHVGCMAVFDDGGGPALFVTGWFDQVNGHDANDIAKLHCAPGTRLGDLNCDEAVNGADIDHFVQALLSPSEYVADHDGDPYPPCNLLNGDFNDDGAVNGQDIDGFVAVLLAP